MRRRIHETHTTLAGAQVALKAYRAAAKRNRLEVDARIKPCVLAGGCWVLSAYAFAQR